MNILKHIRNWWHAPPSEDGPYIAGDEPKSEPKGEQAEVWQWQINCVSSGYNPLHRPMPQNFGLLIGTMSDAESRLKASVSLPNYYTTRKTESRSDLTTYEFSDPETEESPRALKQMGGIRCVSREMKLIRRWEGAPISPKANAPFLVKEKDNPYIRHFQFHPIKPQDRFIKGERTGETACDSEHSSGN